MDDKLDIARAQLMESLVAVADTMRTAAQAADVFSKLLKEYSPDLHDDHTKGKRKAASSPEEDDGHKKRKRNTKPKDPNAPKRPASSYILFQNEVRKSLKKQNPELNNAELLALIAEQWKTMPDEQKEASPTYNQAMRDAKALYSEEKKAYDNRTPEEVEAANAAAAAALALKKANAKPRGPKPAAATAEIKARPPPPPQEVSPSSESSEDEDSDEEEPAPKPKSKKAESDTSSSDEEEEEEEPAPKKRRGASVQPPASKSKKNSKA
ncbi:high mobility group box domain-containing protein [Gymnopilus junonius]|uniref:High mobility group box domain-containing protein n=1 Tax=Gymnopilus junonius TaxID=109634 RepID=A0A9P5NJG7_GYMJU|nr:high mobility group box domain-containing protein [Gymnopilus junonius]